MTDVTLPAALPSLAADRPFFGASSTLIEGAIALIDRVEHERPSAGDLLGGYSVTVDLVSRSIIVAKHDGARAVVVERVNVDPRDVDFGTRAAPRAGAVWVLVRVDPVVHSAQRETT